MLILQRAVGEKIIIEDEGRKITVTRLGTEVVRLGFEADRDVRIYREELIGREVKR